MKILESAENYLESIHILKTKNGQVRAIDIVNHLGFSKPSVSVALKQLENNGYILRDASGLISLTKEGEKIASAIYERHDVIRRMFLAIGVSPDTAEKDACKVEHHISEETFSCLKKHLAKNHD